MFCVSLQKKPHKFQEESSDLEAQLLELGFVFYDDALSAPRADDTCGLAGTVYERYGLAFEAQALSTIYGNSVDASDMAAAGYVLRDGDWYRKSGRNVCMLPHNSPCFRSLSFGKSWTAFWNAKSLRLMWPLVLPCLTNSLVQ